MIFLVILVDFPVVLAGKSIDSGIGDLHFAGERDCRENRNCLPGER
jgi:hypothetical protein